MRGRRQTPAQSVYEHHLARLNEWANTHCDFLSAVFQAFDEEGDWPRLEPLQRRIEQAGEDMDLAAAVAKLPPELGRRVNQQIILTPRGLSYVRAASLMVQAFVDAQRLAYERYRDTRTAPVLRRQDLVEGLGLSADQVLRVSRLLFDDAWVFGSGRGGPADDWELDVVNRVRIMRDVGSAADYFATRGRTQWPGVVSQKESNRERSCIARILGKPVRFLSVPQERLTVGGLLLVTVIAGLVVALATVLISDDQKMPTVLQSGAKVDGVRIITDADPRSYERGLPNWTSYSFVIPRPPARIPEPPSTVCRDWRAWAHGLGGVDADSSTSRVIVQSAGQAAVLIDGLEVTFTRRRPPLQGTTVQCTAGGAVASIRNVRIALDGKPPSAEYFDADAMQPSRAPLFKLGPQGTEVLNLIGHTRSCWCTWRANLRVIVDGHLKLIQVGRDEDVFSTTPTTRTVVRWDGTRWVSAT